MTPFLRPKGQHGNDLPTYNVIEEIKVSILYPVPTNLTVAIKMQIYVCLTF